MLRSLVVLAGLLVASPLSAQVVGCAPESGVQFRETLATLEGRESMTVSGAAVGFAGQPGEWYGLACMIRNNAKQEQLLALLQHERVHVRAAGMFGLAHAFPEVAAEALEGKLKSPVELELMAGGCCVEEVTEGELARRFLANRYFLDLGKEPAPLRKPGEVADGAAPAEPTAAERFAAAKATLLAESEGLAVSGSRVGRGAQPGRFFLLIQDLRVHGTKEQLVALLAHERVVVRLAGAACLAERFPELAAERLEALRASEVPVDYMPSGCTVERATEGYVVQQLYANRHALNSDLKPEPLPTR
ncbi:MAG: hypothetical protein R3F62_23055 [Planctomycetota bacterium]